MSGASGSISFQTATGEHLKPRIGYVPQSPSFDPGDPVSVLDSVRDGHLPLAGLSAYPGESCEARCWNA